MTDRWTRAASAPVAAVEPGVVVGQEAAAPNRGSVREALEDLATGEEVALAAGVVGGGLDSGLLGVRTGEAVRSHRYHHEPG